MEIKHFSLLNHITQVVADRSTTKITVRVRNELVAFKIVASKTWTWLVTVFKATFVHQDSNKMAIKCSQPAIGLQSNEVKLAITAHAFCLG